MPEHEVRAHIDECLEEACLEAIQGKPDAKIAAALLEHREQRFRLSYILGAWRASVESDDDDFSFEDDVISEAAVDDEEAVSSEEVEQHRERLASFVSAIKELSKETGSTFEASLGKLKDQKTADDRATWLELFGVEAFRNPKFSSLALDIMDEVADRFTKIDAGNTERSATDWPLI